MNVLMPQLGETVTEGTVANWHKKVGDTVAADEIILDIETDKVSMEIPSPGAGVITQILVPAGTTVDVGTVLAVDREQRERRRASAAGARGASPPRPRRHRPRRRSGGRAAVVVRRDAAGHEHGEGAVHAARRDRRLRVAGRDGNGADAVGTRQTTNACRRPCAASRPSIGSILKAVPRLGPQRPHHAAQRARVHSRAAERSRAPRAAAAARTGTRRRVARRCRRAARPAARARGSAAGRREDRAVHAHSQAHGRAHGPLEGHEPARAASRRGRLPPRRPRAQDRCATPGRRSTATR